MSLEARIEQLESELFQVRKMLHHKDEDQHEIWNNMQEEIHKKVGETYFVIIPKPSGLVGRNLKTI
ncbi:hypothetical protein GZ77_23410 [Endozoicomonas montiporae]|uniref:Uncharacterized protein n=2 Tax=Endozoicomonas montiporae TaxID=1027273 RepID=A0A081N0R1_9GAMM|nr:hypothetical protein [Endozoicomonas montiporae]AMO54513.1 hypothetical protein EZMO1_0248 [Endozoicomonas montiporae CL-33]KEQ12034.1 hypothetical protein GZ77_23410 [Endozoicomonas montiporae]